MIFPLSYCSQNSTVTKSNYQEQTYPSKYQASISSDYDDSNNVLFHLSYKFPKQSNYSGHELILNAHIYGKYWTFNPYIKNPIIVLDAFSQGVGGILSLPKQEEMQLIFFINGDKNEFNVKIQDNVVKVTPSQQSQIVFDPSVMNLLPENLLIISYRNQLSDSSLYTGLHEKLIELGCISQQLPLGDYYKFQFTGYVDNDEFAHTERMSNKLYYFFKVQKNYAKVFDIIKSYYKMLNKDSSQYKYDYNFNMNQKIEEETNPELRVVNLQGPSFPKELQFPDLHEKEVAEISFNLEKPQKVKIGIFDMKGNNIKDIELTSSSSGNFTYTWDGKASDGERVDKGVYFYKLSINDSQTFLKKIILR